jgi:uncharacterized protein YbjT (DUF2867 family)
MILVTGATGLVGSHLLHDLVVRGNNVRALKRKNSSLDLVKTVFTFFGQESLLQDKIMWIEGDMFIIVLQSFLSIRETALKS